MWIWTEFTNHDRNLRSEIQKKKKSNATLISACNQIFVKESTGSISVGREKKSIFKVNEKKNKKKTKEFRMSNSWKKKVLFLTILSYSNDFSFDYLAAWLNGY